jgi:endo-1,4-beta-mannosidase
MHGVVLTDASDLAALMAAFHRAELGALKIVTGWGSDWKRAEVGDGIKPPDPNKLREAIKPWYATRNDLIIEIGNEPNSAANISDQRIWEYRAVTDACIAMLRSEFPGARIISPALLTGNNYLRWFAVCYDVFNKADYIGVHAYEWHSFSPAGTYQLSSVLAAARRYHSKPVFITELGINDKGTSAATKAQRYRKTIGGLAGYVAGCVCYHVCDNPLDDDQRAYALDLSSLAYLR